MSNNKKNNNNKFPFANEIIKMKSEFKNFIDCMSNEEFIDFISFLEFSFADFENEDWTFDEDWEDEAEKFYCEGNNKSNYFNNDELPF